MEKIFKHFAPVTKSWVTKDTVSGAEQRFMEVTLSGIKADRDGDRMSKNAVKGMIKQLKSATIPFYLDHGLDSTGERNYRLKDMAGVWVDGREEGTDMKAVVRLNNANKDADTVWSYKEQGMPIGFSIGGKIVKTFQEDAQDGN